MSADVEENGSINPAVVGIDLGFSGRKPRGSVIDQRFSPWERFPRENGRNTTVSARCVVAIAHTAIQATGPARVSFLLLILLASTVIMLLT